ncbi:YcxB-like protein [Mobilisporobacter senegalensis]|uniref:YcxB-like protein n=1 Tax=Mobilisporobacter senegalensis TaxID=1329262 RepID=A0A3N1XUQ9_9FIRM|nr:YcxB family protein [Mobilisporobacter senegalensis]ROR30365.1 YcxB-like protein [Mobilisporobacter senegalensis]
MSKVVNEGKNNDILGHHCLFITEESIIEKSENSESKYNIIEKVAETEKHLFIYVNTVSAYIIPKKYLSVEEKNELLKITNNLIG